MEIIAYPSSECFLMIKILDLGDGFDNIDCAVREIKETISLPPDLLLGL